LKVLGIDLGPNLMPAESNNEKGYWEDLDVFALNEGLLEAVDASWDDLCPNIGSLVASESVSPMRLRASQLLTQKTANAPWLGLKDPRIARLLPFWKPVFSELRVDVKYLLAFRNPLGVAASLAKRDGFPFQKSMYLWLEHVIPAVIDTQGHCRSALDYDRLLTDPNSELRRVASDLGLGDRLNEHELAQFCNDFLDPQLRHAQFTAKDLRNNSEIPALVKDVFGALVRVSSGELSANSDAVDKEFSRFAESLHELHPLLTLLADTERKAGGLRTSLLQRDEAVAALEQELRERNAELDALREAVLERETRIAAALQAAAERDDKISRLVDMLTERETEAEEMSQRLRDAIGERDALLGSTSWRVTAPLRGAILLARKSGLQAVGRFFSRPE
jgi:hypothetical protein